MLKRIESGHMAGKGVGTIEQRINTNFEEKAYRQQVVLRGLQGKPSERR